MLLKSMNPFLKHGLIKPVNFPECDKFSIIPYSSNSFSMVGQPYCSDLFYMVGAYIPLTILSGQLLYFTFPHGTAVLIIVLQYIFILILPDILFSWVISTQKYKMLCMCTLGAIIDGCRQCGTRCINSPKKKLRTWSGFLSFYVFIKPHLSSCHTIQNPVYIWTP